MAGAGERSGEPPGAPVLRRLFSWILHSCGGLIAAALMVVPLIAGMGIARLTTGPVPLDIFLGEVQQLLASALPGYQLTVGHAELAWNGWSEPVQLRAREVSVVPPGSSDRMMLPAVGFSFDFAQALKGVVAPTRLSLFSPELKLVLTPRGTFDLDIGTLANALPPAGDGAATLPPSGEGAGNSAELSGAGAAPAPDAIAQLLGVLDGGEGGGRLSGAHLRAVRIIDAHLIIDDQRRGTEWEATHTTLGFSRDAQGLVATLDADLQLAGRTVTIAGRARYDAASGSVLANLNFDNFSPAALAPKLPDVPQLTMLDMPIGGSGAFTFTRGLVLQRAVAHIDGQNGLLSAGKYFQQPLGIDSLSGAVEADMAMRTFTFSDVKLHSGDAVVTANGRLEPYSDKGWTLVADAGADGVAMNDLTQYWPVDASPHAREWVTGNLLDGIVPHAEIHVVASQGDQGDVWVRRLDGFIDVNNLSVHYLRPMPPVEHVNGRASFNATTMEIAVESGTLGTIAVQPSHLTISDLGAPPGRNEHMDMQIITSGPVVEMLRLVNHPRLALLKKLGLDPEQVSGDAGVNLKLSFPLLNDLPMEEIAVGAAANIKNATVSDTVAPLSLTAGDLALTVDGSGLQVKGAAQLDGRPAKIEWKEDFRHGTQTPRTLSVEMTADQELLMRRWGLATAPWLMGPVPVKLGYRQSADKTQRLDLVGDLTQSTLSLPQLGWSKQPGTAGEVSASLLIDDKGIEGVPSFNIAIGGDQLAGSVLLQNGSTLRQLRLDRAKLGPDDFSAIVDRQPGVYNVRLSGKALDLRPLLADKPAPEGQTEQERKAAEAKAIEEAKAAAARRAAGKSDVINAELDLASLTFKDKMALTAVKGRIRLIDGLLMGADVKAASSSGTPVEFSVTPQDANSVGRPMRVATDDAGAVLRDFGLTDNVTGGKLTIEGLMHEDNDRPDKTLIEGRLWMTDYRLVRAPLLARIVKAATLGGIGDLLEGSGLSFARLETQYSWNSPYLTIDGLRTSGGNLGVTAQGVLDTKAKTIELNGQVVPALAVNSFLQNTIGRIPLIGSIVTGTSGGGLVATTYSVRGGFDNAEVNVNPFSTLTPGFLRDLFFVPAPVKAPTTSGGG